MTAGISSFDIPLDAVRFFRAYSPLSGRYAADAPVLWTRSFGGDVCLRIDRELVGVYDPLSRRDTELTDEEKQMILDIIYARWGS